MLPAFNTFNSINIIKNVLDFFHVYYPNDNDEQHKLQIQIMK